MKNRLISFITCVILLLTAVLSGCSSENKLAIDDASIDETINDTPPAELAYKAKRFYFPSDYECVPRTASVYNGRIYMACEKVADRDNYRTETYIFSMNLSGDKHEFVPYTKAADDSFIYHMKVASDGSKLYFEYVYDYNTQTLSGYLTKHAPSGEQIFSIAVQEDFFPETQLGSSTRMSVVDMTADNDGNIYLLSYSGVCALTPDGQKAFDVPLTAPKSVVNISGKVAAMYQKGNTSDYQLKYINPVTAAIDEETLIPLPPTVMGDSNKFNAYEKPPEDDSDYLYYLKTSLGLLGVDEAGTTSVINWIDSDIDTNNIDKILSLGGEKFFSAGYYAMYFLNETPVDTSDEKQIIELAHIDYGNYAAATLPSIVTKFNQLSNEYKVRLVTYTPDADAGIQAEFTLDNDITAGKVPDMFLFQSGNRVGDDMIAKYERNNMLVDLYEYMDNNFANNLLGCVRGPLERDGKLFRSAYEIAVQSPIAKVENADLFKNWTLEKYLDTAENLSNDGSGRSLLSISDQINLQVSTGRYITQFVDGDAGTCSFDDGLFVMFLQYAKTLPTEQDVEADAAGHTDGSILLRHRYLSDVNSLMSTKRVFGITDYSEVTFVGYPSNPSGVVIDTSSYAISQSADQAAKDGAWEFIKFAMSDDVLLNSDSGKIPATKSALDGAIKSVQKLFFLVYEGGGLRSSDQRWSNSDIKREEANGAVSMRFTKKDGIALTDLLNSAVGIPTVNSKIVEIVNEEAAAFLADSKSAEEAAADTQSRVSAVLAEMK